MLPESYFTTSGDNFLKNNPMIHRPRNAGDCAEMSSPFTDAELPFFASIIMDFTAPSATLRCISHAAAGIHGTGRKNIHSTT